VFDEHVDHQGHQHESALQEALVKAMESMDLVGELMVAEWGVE